MADPLGPIAAHPERAGILLDFDGTLAPIVARPEDVGLAPGAKELLESLVSRFGLLAVISGRPPEALVELVGVSGIRYEGLYGLSRTGAGADTLRAQAESVAGLVPGAWVESKGVTLAVHYRQAGNTARARDVLWADLRALADEAGYEVFEGKMVLELAPAGESRKGGAVTRLVREAGLEAALYAGDDLPDLEGFAALDELAASGLRAVRIAVGGTELPDALRAAADLVVDGPPALIEALRGLA